MSLAARSTLRATLLRGLVAGAIAGLTTGLAALLFAEPTVAAAIALEPTDGKELLSRATQKAGLVLGLMLVGLALGALFALVYRGLPDDLRARPWQRALTLALAAFTALHLVAFLRYPANPPGVGDESTLDDRTSAYFLCLALGVAVVSGAFLGLRALARRGVAPRYRQSAVAVLAFLLVGAVYALLPSSAPLGDVPADLVWDFRVRALGLQALLYALLGAVFGLLSEQAADRSRMSSPTPGGHH